MVLRILLRMVLRMVCVDVVFWGGGDCLGGF